MTAFFLWILQYLTEHFFRTPAGNCFWNNKTAFHMDVLKYISEILLVNIFHSIMKQLCGGALRNSCSKHYRKSPSEYRHRIFLWMKLSWFPSFFHVDNFFQLANRNSAIFQKQSFHDVPQNLQENRCSGDLFVSVLLIFVIYLWCIVFYLCFLVLYRVKLVLIFTIAASCCVVLRVSSRVVTPVLLQTRSKNHS